MASSTQKKFKHIVHNIVHTKGGHRCQIEKEKYGKFLG